MTAAEARHIATSKRRENYSQDYLSVQIAIKKAVQEGKLSMWYYGNMTPDLKTFLESEGFKVREAPDGRGGTDVEISW